MGRSQIQETYQAFLSSPDGAERFNRFKWHLYGEPDSLVLRIIPLVSSLVSVFTPIIFDAGGGDGKRLLQLLTLLDEQGIRGSAVLADQSAAFTRALRVMAARYRFRASDRG